MLSNTHSYRHFRCYIVSYWTFVTCITVTSHCFLHHRSIVISRSGSEMSLVYIVHIHAFLPIFCLIVYHYYAHVNAFTLVHLCACVCFDRISVSPLHTEEGHRIAWQLCVITCIDKSRLKSHHLETTLSLCIYIYIYDEGSLLPKYRDCTTSNDLELYLMCCGVMLQ